jgi:hypothetical protein
METGASIGWRRFLDTLLWVGKDELIDLIERKKIEK